MLKIGDVFKGKPGFEFGRDVSVGVQSYREGLDLVQVSDSYKETYKIREIKSHDRKTGKPNYMESKRHAHDDKTRPAAEFVVESVEIRGGDLRVFIYDEPHIVARRLNKDGTYNPQGELITFVDAYKSRSNFDTAVIVSAHRTMTRTVNFV
jgi:hypothetical protein